MLGDCRVQSLKRHFTNEQLNRFVNYVLHYIADLDIPIKRYVLQRGWCITMRNSGIFTHNAICSSCTC
jgi:hypothetical protein